MKSKAIGKKSMGIENSFKLSGQNFQVNKFHITWQIVIDVSKMYVFFAVKTADANSKSFSFSLKESQFKLCIPPPLAPTIPASEVDSN